MKTGEIRIYKNPSEFYSSSCLVRLITGYRTQMCLSNRQEGGYHAVERYEMIGPSILGAWNDD